MKKSFYTLVFIISLSLCQAASAQTNTFPASGNVGIGTTTPGTNKLQVFNGASGGTAYNSGGLVVESNTRSSIQLLAPSANDEYLFLGDPNAGNAAFIGHYGHTMNPADLLIFYSLGNYGFTGGNVGIGTTSPSAKLHIYSGALRVDLNSTGVSSTFTGSSSNLQIYHDASSTVKLLNSGGGGYGFQNSANSATVTTIDNNGNIATNGPVTASYFSGAGTYLTGTANGLSIGGTAAGENFQTITARQAYTAAPVIAVGNSSLFGWGSGMSGFQLSNSGGIFTGGGGYDTFLGVNTYRASSTFVVATSATYQPTFLQIQNGSMYFDNAPAGAVGSTITSTHRFMVDPSGDVSITGSYTGSGSGLTGTASSLSIGGTAAGETLQTITSRNATTSTGANFGGTITAASFQSTSLGSGGIGSSFLAEGSATPGFGWYNTASGVDSKSWDAYASGNYLLFRGVNDAQNAATNWLMVNRSGLTINSVSFPNGNVGIGTTNPQSALSVNGTITGKQVTVTQTGWPDFVFDPEHKLRPLSEVKSFIEKSKHLPGIPPAKEIETKGLNLGEMEKKQMQKIEELTLYQITAEEKIKRLENELDSLKKQFEEFKSRLK